MTSAAALPIRFISDLHLEVARPDTTQQFFEFIDRCQNQVSALYILGDFFDAWIGDDDVSPWNQAIIDKLRQFTYQPTPLYLMHGNRDFLLGDTFCRETGAQMLEDPTLLDLFDRRVLLMHGDTLCIHDYKYMEFRKMVRAPQWQAAFLAKPLAERRAMANAARAQSQAENKLKPSDIMDADPSTIMETVENYDVELLIHGHTHRPGQHEIKLTTRSAQRIVLPDWYETGGYLEFTAAGPALKYF